MQLYAIEYIEYAIFSTNLCEKQLISRQQNVFTLLNVHLKLLFRKYGAIKCEMEISVSDLFKSNVTSVEHFEYQDNTVQQLIH